MVNQNELRLGNIIQSPAKEHLTVISIEANNSISKLKGQSVVTQYSYEEIFPINITAEILESCGFEKFDFYHNSEACYKKGKYFIAENGWFHIITSPNNAVILNENIKYLHRLQNLYFALTGDELTVQRPKI